MITYVIMLVCFFLWVLVRISAWVRLLFVGVWRGWAVWVGFGGLYGVVVWVVVAGCAAGVCFRFVGLVDASLVGCGLWLRWFFYWILCWYCGAGF